jgi:putative copper export protein
VVGVSGGQIRHRIIVVAIFVVATLPATALANAPVMTPEYLADSMSAHYNGFLVYALIVLLFAALGLFGLWRVARLTRRDPARVAETPEGESR